MLLNPNISDISSWLIKIWRHSNLKFLFQLKPNNLIMESSASFSTEPRSNNQLFYSISFWFQKPYNSHCYNHHCLFTSFSFSSIKLFHFIQKNKNILIPYAKQSFIGFNIAHRTANTTRKSKLLIYIRYYKIATSII